MSSRLPPLPQGSFLKFLDEQVKPRLGDELKPALADFVEKFTVRIHEVTIVDLLRRLGNLELRTKRVFCTS